MDIIRVEYLVSPQWSTLLTLLILTLTSVVCIEETRPAIFLSPRNFNPHPYEAGYDPRDRMSGNTGPVVFPPSPPDEDNTLNRNVLILSNPRNSQHYVDNHPYAKVAKKHKYKVAGRFNNLDNHVNPEVYEALSSHAAKVLSKPPSQLGKDYTISSLQDQTKNYAFSYKVVDHLTGDDFSHTQSQNSRATNGEYRVKLPDGRVQIVSYIADKNGYKADVKYTEDDPSPPTQQPNLKILSTRKEIRPVVLQPVSKTNSYDYQYDDTAGSNLPFPLYDDRDIFFHTAVPTQQSKLSSSQSYYSGIPKSVYYTEGVENYSTQPKVEIYSNNYRINRPGNYLGSTVAPYLFHNSKNYRGNVISTTISPDLEGFSQVYVNTPKFRLIQNQQHDDAVYGK